MENLKKDAFDEIGDGMIPMKPIMRAAQKAGVKHCHAEQDHSPLPLCRAFERASGISIHDQGERFLPSGFSLVCRFTQKSKALLIVSDDLKADALGCYGSEIAQTPNVDQLARGRHALWKRLLPRTVCRPSRASFMRGRYHGEKEITWGEHFQKNGYSSTRVGKIFHMRVPGDIIAGTDGDGVPACWSAKYNMPGKEAHTPGNYACLNLDKFTTELQGRQSTKMPFRMFVTVDYAGDGSDQPDWKAATKSVELLKNFKKEGKAPSFWQPDSFAPTTRTPRPSSISNATPSSK